MQQGPPHHGLGRSVDGQQQSQRNHRRGAPVAAAGFSRSPALFWAASSTQFQFRAPMAYPNQHPQMAHAMAPQYAAQQMRPAPPQGSSAPSGPRHSGPSNQNGHAEGHEEEDEDGQGKRRRVQRACDVCRKKKIRCDGLQPDKGSCSNCATYGHQCTFVDAAKKRAPPRSYVDALEARMERMEKLLVTLAPGVDFTDRIGPPVRLPGEENNDSNQEGHGRDASGGLPTSLRMAGLDQPSGSGSNPASDEAESDDDHITFIVDDLRAAKLEEEEESMTAHERQGSGHGTKLSRGNSLHASDSPASGASANREDGTRVTQSFIGMASDLHLISILDRINNKREASGGPDAINNSSLNTSMDLLKARGFGQKARAVPPLGGGEGGVDVETLKLPWPPVDLEDLLLDSYFKYCHAEYPILNEVVFRQEVKERPELRLDPAWASIAFTVFALASRYTDDPRVIDPQAADNFSDAKATAGFDFWLQRRRLQLAMRFCEVNLHVVQCVLIGTIYMLYSCSSITVPWAMLGVAVRMLEEIGAHRKVTAAKLGFPLVTEETFRRLWWTVYSLDRDMSSGLGRPMAIHDEDFDVDPPLPIDDDVIYRASLNETTPVQPQGKPSHIAAFACLTQLDQIIGRTLRTIYAIGKAKMKRGFVGAQWDLFILTEIDSALNHWLSTVPDHLRYDPNEPDEQTLILSSQIYARYYQAQILLHRSFLPSPYSRSKENFPSLAICTNAARSISHVVWNLYKRGLLQHGAFSLAFRAFTAGCMLLVVVWAAKQNGSVTSPSTIADIHKCTEVLEAMANRSFTAERFSTTLKVLLESSDIKPLEVERGTKRNVEGGAAEGASFGNAFGGANANEAMASVDKAKRPQATSRRALAASESSQRIVSSLPFSTTELATAFSSNTTSPRSQASTQGSPGSQQSPMRQAPQQQQQQQQPPQHFQPGFPQSTPPMPSGPMGGGPAPMGLQTPRQGMPSWEAVFASGGERGAPNGMPYGASAGGPGSDGAAPSFAYLFSDPVLAGPMGIAPGGPGGAAPMPTGLTPGTLPPSFFANLTPGIGGLGSGGDLDMASAFNFGNASDLGFESAPAPAADPARGLAHAGGAGSGVGSFNPMATTPSDPLESLYAQRNLGWEPPEWLNRVP